MRDFGREKSMMTCRTKGDRAVRKAFVSKRAASEGK